MGPVLHRLRRSLRDDRGIALPIVVMLALVMVIAISAGLTTALSGMRAAASNEDRSAAWDAAYAGVQDYLVRINADASYGQYGTTDAAFSAGSTFVTQAVPNPAFGTGTGGTWASVQTGGTPTTCPAGALTACFRYAVDNRRLAIAGVIRLQSTGRVGRTTRSIVVEVKRQGFVNYLWYTDYEVQDPRISNDQSCAVYVWQTTRPSTCRISFAATDVLSGPVHSNDTIAVTCGATFTRLVTTANPKSTNWDPGTCGTNPFQAGGPNSVALIKMPATNSAMKNQTRSDLVPNPGCLYTGPTVVKYTSDGKMTVWSPWTKFTNTTDTSGSNPGKCGTPGTDPGGLGTAEGATVPQLDLNLLYVQTLPPAPTGSAAPDPNYQATNKIPTGMTCYGGTGTNKVTDAAASVGWKFGPWSFPTANEAAPDGWDGKDGIGGTNWSPGTWSQTNPAYNCRNGDLFVSGQVTKQTTAAADDYVYVTDDLTYADSTQDVLGLVGDAGVLVWNPVNSLGQPLLASDTDRMVSAAVLSTAHSFQVQNFNLGSVRGTLTVLGSIAQEFRGPVATANAVTGAIQTGYRKDYRYDPLLENVSPPYFLAPTSTTFVPRIYMSTRAAWSSTGAAQ